LTHTAPWPVNPYLTGATWAVTNNVSKVVRSGLRMLQDAEEHRAAFVASLHAALEEGLREGLSTIGEVEAEVSAAIDEVRRRKEQAA